MHLLKCLYLLILISYVHYVPFAESKIKKIKAVKKLLKAKILLKPLLKSGVFKFPMIHFVIPVVKPNAGQQQAPQQSRVASLSELIRPARQPTNFNRRIKCNQMIGPQQGAIDESGSRVQRETNECVQPNNNDGDGSSFSFGAFPVISFGSLSRIIPTLFGASFDQSNGRRFKNNCRPCLKQPKVSPIPQQSLGQFPYSEQQLKASEASEHATTLQDFGNLSMDEFISQKPVIALQEQRQIKWNKIHNDPQSDSSAIDIEPQMISQVNILNDGENENVREIEQPIVERHREKMEPRFRFEIYQTKGSFRSQNSKQSFASNQNNNGQNMYSKDELKQSHVPY